MAAYAVVRLGSLSSLLRRIDVYPPPGAMETLWRRTGKTLDFGRALMARAAWPRSA